MLIGATIRKLIKIAAIALSTIVAIVLLIMAAITIFLTSDRLTPIINRYSDDFINGDIEFKRVELTFFRHFPSATISLEQGQILSDVLKADTTAADSARNLVSFRKLDVSVNLLAMLAGRVSIERIALQSPNIYAFVSSSGRANWDIVQSDTTSTQSDEQRSSLKLAISTISIDQGANISYLSMADSTQATVALNSLLIDGNLTNEFKKISINRFAIDQSVVQARLLTEDFSARFTLDSLVLTGKKHRLDIDMKSSIWAQSRGVVLVDNQSITLDGGFEMHQKLAKFDHLRLVAAGIPLEVNGTMNLKPNKIDSDLTLTSTGLNMGLILDLIPAEYRGELTRLHTNIITNLALKLTGEYTYDNSRIPSLALTIDVPSGSVSYKGAPSQIDHVSFKAHLDYDHQNPSKAKFTLNSLHLDGGGVNIGGHIEATDIISSPLVTLEMKGSVDIARSIKLLPQEYGYQGRGTLNLKANGSFRVKDLTAERLGNTNIDFSVDAPQIRLRSPKDSLSMMAQNTHFDVNTMESITNKRTGKRHKILTVTLTGDTARVRYKQGMLFCMADMDFSLRGSPSAVALDTTRVNAIVGKIKARMLEFDDVDSSRYRIRGASFAFRSLPSRDNRSLPVLSIDIAADMLAATTQGNRAFVRKAAFSFMAQKRDLNQLRGRYNKYLDSLQRLHPDTPRDSLMVRLVRARRVASRDAFSNRDIDMRVDGVVRKFINRWDLSGKLTAEAGGVITPYFPARNHFSNLNLTLSGDSIVLHDTHINSGHTKLTFNGSISGIRQALTSSRGLSIVAKLSADTLDANQLLTTLGNGMNYINSSQGDKEKIINAKSDAELETSIDNLNTTSTPQSSMIVIPANIYADLVLDVKYAKYANLTINKMKGELLMRDRCLQLKDMVIDSDAGEIDLSALFATYSPTDINIGVDMEFKDVQVDRLISMVPEVNEYLPMLSSFRGIVSCVLATTASVDSSMNVILPSINGVCRISGRDMVLMDGATFSQIAKTLMFKNKKENVVKKISAEMLVRDNKVEIFPFVMDIDRYSAAIAGVQGLDMSFNYHISILHSPIPFRFGVNVFGNDMDQMKFRIGKAKYNNSNIPATTNLVDTTRINLRNAFADIIRKGIHNARMSSSIERHAASASNHIPADLEQLTSLDSLHLAREGIIQIDTTKLDLPQNRVAPRPLTKAEQRAARRALRKMR